ncbi:MAG: DUF6569 family protein [Nanoarchaeota archaeon]|mgnify:CR=1 FL=1
MQEIISSVRELQQGKIQQFGNLALVPLFGEQSSLDYLILREAIAQGFQVSENPKGAHVPQLYVINGTGKKVLAIQGEYVVGGKQNRTFTRNVYFNDNFKGEIPVRCVEAGRWHSEDNSSGTFSSSGVVPRSLSQAESQGDTWLAASTYLDESTVHSATSDVGETYRSRQGDFDFSKQHFSFLEGQTGMIAVFMQRRKKLFVADIFDQQHRFSQYFSGLLESHILDSGLDSKENVNLTESEVRKFLDSADGCCFQDIPPISLGKDYTLHGEDLSGHVLSYEGNRLYTHLYIPFNHRQDDTLDTELVTDIYQAIIN